MSLNSTALEQKYSENKKCLELKNFGSTKMLGAQKCWDLKKGSAESSEGLGADTLSSLGAEKVQIQMHSKVLG